MPATDIGILVTLDEEALKNQAILDYTSRDFQAIRNELVGLARGMVPDWKSAGESGDFGTILLELFAYMGDTLNYYIDRTASEAFLATAVRPQSVLYIADMIGYTPTGQSSATVTLTWTAYTPSPDDPLEPFTIPAGTVAYSQAATADQAITFETLSPLTIKPGETGTTVASEGTSIKAALLGTAMGVPNTEFVLPQRGIIANSITVVSEEGPHSITWTYTSDLATSRPTQSVFTTFTDDQGRTHIVFGDNTSGRIPSINARIFANYRFGVGSLGNTPAVDEINTFAPRSEFEAWKVTVTNGEVPRGGADAESIQSMKFTIPRAGARVRGRAVTLNDYADLAMQVPGVAKSMSYGTVYTAVKVRVAPALSSSADDLSDEAFTRLRNSVFSYMQDKILIGSQVIIEPDSTSELWCDIFIRVTIHVSEVYNRTSVRQQVDAVIRKLLAYDRVDFGVRVTLGDIYRAALTVSGVMWAEVRWLSTTNPTIDAVAPPSELIGPDTGVPLSPTLTLFQGSWNVILTTTPADPAATNFRVLDDTPADPEFVILVFSHTDLTDPAAGSNNRTSDLALLDVGDHVLMQTKGDGATWWDYVIHEPPVVTAGSPGYITMKAKLSRSSSVVTNPVANQDAFFEFIRFSPTPVSTGTVNDIVTPEINIPRIEPTEVIEDSTDWEVFAPTEEERTHDGLWVVAIGGVANS